MKKLLRLIVGLCLIVSIFSSKHNIQAVHAQTVVDITTAAQLYDIRNNLAGTYRLAADIDLSSYPNWTPIGGSDPNFFTGELDGNGKKITGLKITETTGSGQGLFGVTGSAASIHDLTIIGAAVTAGDNAGILVGMNGGSIQRCGAGGSVSGKENVGGLVGQNTGSITASYSTATVTGQASVGGLAGLNSGNISSSYAASPILASVFNNYIQFDGSDDYIRIGNIPQYQTASFTLEAWFQWDSAYLYDGAANNDADVQFIVGKGMEQFEIHTEGGAKERGIRFIPIPRTSIVGESSDAYNDVLNVIQPGWFHVAASWDYTTKEVRVYVNGVQQDIYHYALYPTHVNDGLDPEISLKNPGSNPFALNTYDLLIGARSPGTVGGNPSMYFKGKIADVRFWNIVRTGAQIDADKSKQLNGTETGLMGYWKLNEGAGTEAFDSSTNQNKGYLMNSPTWVQESTSGVGGLVGSAAGGAITSSYYDKDVSNMSDTGNGDGKTTAELKSQATFDGWDFENTWQITEGVTYPDFIHYQLTYAAGSNGSLTGVTSQTVSNGGSGTPVTAVPVTGYHFVDWSDGSTINPRTDINVTDDVNVTANFAINQYTLTYTAGANGSLSGSASQTVDYNNSGTPVTAVPGTGYHFVKWNDESTANPRTDINVTDDLNVTASFAINQYSLMYTAGGNGSISGSSAQTVDHGSDGSPVTASPAAGYHFLKWSDESTANPRTDLNITDDLSVTASFAINQYTLDYTAGPNGSLSGSGHQVIDHGGSGSVVTAVPADHYHFVNWSDGSTANPRTDANVTANLSVTANFSIDQYTLDYAGGANGSLSGSTHQVVDRGASGSAVTAVPADHYHFVNWSDGSEANPRTDENVTANLSVTANFAIDQYTLGYTAGTNGSLSGSVSQTVDHGSSGSAVTAVAADHYHFVDWSDGSEANPRTDENVTSNLSVTANFAIDQYTLNYAAGTNGSLSGSASQMVDHGASGSAVTAVPAEHYHFVNWSDGKSDNPRTDLNVTTNLSITANFAIDQYTLDYAAGTHGSLSGSTLQAVDHGGSGSAVTAVPAEHYHFVNWSDGSEDNPRTDTNVTSNLSVTANFAIDQYTLNYTAGTGGSLSGSASQTVDHGSSGSSINAVPDTGYHFVNWSDDSTANPRTDTNVTANMSVTANFAINQYTLDYAAGTHGSLSGSTHQVVDHGGSGSAVTAIADYNYYFVDWSDGSTANPRTDLNVTANLSATANFTFIATPEPDLLSLSRTTVSTVQDEVGSFRVQNGEPPMTYSLQTSGDVCTGINGADNAAFTVSGSRLEKLLSTTDGAYSICAQAEDSYGRVTQAAFTIQVTPPPSDLQLSSQTVTTGQTLVGTLSSVNGLTPYRYRLENSGAVCSASHTAANALFEVEGNGLKRLANTPAGKYRVCLQTTDANGATYQKEVEVTVSPVTPAPVEWAVELTADQIIESDPVGTVVGSLVSNRSGTLYTLVDMTTFPFAQHFSINSDGKLILAQALPPDAPLTLPIRVRAATPLGETKDVDSVITIMKNGSSAGASAVDDAGNVQAGSSLLKDVLANDQISTEASSWVSMQIVRYPNNGSAEISGPAFSSPLQAAIPSSPGIIYTPNPGFSGTDSVTYRACDNLDYCVMGSVEYTVVKTIYTYFLPIIAIEPR